MKAKRILAGLSLLALTATAFGESRRFDVQVAFGGWSLSPFRSIVERECERIIKREFSSLVETVIPAELLTPLLSSVELSSSGTAFSLTAAYRFGDGRFAAGVRGDYFDFGVPFTLSVAESIEILGWQLVSLEGRGSGTVDLGGFALSAFGRWTPVLTPSVELSFHAGLMMLPFQGKIVFDLSAVMKTALGDLRYAGKFDDDFDQIRELGLDIPEFIFSPMAGIEFRYRFSQDIGFCLDATAAQGSFLSAGLFFVF